MTKIVNESLLEFQRQEDPHRALGVGVKNKILEELYEINIHEEDVEITSNNIIKPISRMDSGKWTDIYDIQLKYISKEMSELITNIYKIKNSINLTINEAIKNKISKKDIELILDIWGNDTQKKHGKIALSKYTRKRDEKKYDNHNNVYVFIGFEDKKPVMVNGKKYYEDFFNTEGMIKIDKFNGSDLQMVGMMQVRAQYQGNGARVYMINIPKDWMDEDRYENIPEEYYYVILDHMKKI